MQMLHEKLLANNENNRRGECLETTLLHLNEIMEGLYFYFSLHVCVRVCVCVCMCGCMYERVSVCVSVRMCV